MPTRDEVVRMVDHTLLKPEATPDQVEALLDEAARLGTYSICVSPSMLPLPFSPRVKVATVVGFPSGKHTPHVKAAEAAEAVANGAHEVDMVIDIGALKAGDVVHTEDEIRAVRDEVRHDRPVGRRDEVVGAEQEDCRPRPRVRLRGREHARSRLGEGGLLR